MSIFSYIKTVGNINETEMLSTFNCCVGMIIVVEEQHAKCVEELIKKHYDCHKIGKIKKESKKYGEKRNTSIISRLTCDRGVFHSQMPKTYYSPKAT